MHLFEVQMEHQRLGPGGDPDNLSYLAVVRPIVAGSLQVRYVYRVAQQSTRSQPGIDSKRRMKVDHKHSTPNTYPDRKYLHLPQYSEIYVQYIRNFQT